MKNDVAELGAPPARVRRIALFLDLDGVLAELEPRPEAVGPDPRRARVLAAAAERLQGRLAVISGREISDLDRILETGVRAVSGVHGLERRDAEGRLTRAEPAPGVAAAADAFDAFAERRQGVIVEKKGVATGLHYRLAPDAGAEAQALAAELAERLALVHQPGHMIEELKTPGADKGRALEAFMTEPPFAGAVPVMLGDDLTDEYGFEAATRLGGFGVLVGAPRTTAARYRLDGPAAVLDWIERLEAE